MKYAVVKTGGKQYKITEGDVLEVERLPESDKKEITFDEVLLYTADGVVTVGKPMLTGVTIKATVLENTKGKKIRVAKFKAKARYRRVTGHRQHLTKVKIDTIEATNEKAKKVSAETVKSVPAQKTTENVTSSKKTAKTSKK